MEKKKKKIDLFHDKEYEELDWLNKVVEPFIFPLNDIMGQMPDRVEFDYDFVIQTVVNGVVNTIDKQDLILFSANKHALALDAVTLDAISSYFSVEIPQNLSIDFENKTMNGVFALVKTKSQLDDEDIKLFISREVENPLLYCDADKVAIPRINEIMDLLNCTDHRQGRSTGKKMRVIRCALKTVVLEDKWRVRNAELMMKVGYWIVDYVKNGNLAALSNFTRLKCMTHKEMAIYSMEETT